MVHDTDKAIQVAVQAIRELIRADKGQKEKKNNVYMPDSGKVGKSWKRRQDNQKMMNLAIRQMDYSYAPYSHFHVGAALLAKNGTYYTGVTLKMLHIHQQTVRKELLFLKQSVKA